MSGDTLYYLVLISYYRKFSTAKDCSDSNTYCRENRVFTKREDLKQRGGEVLACVTQTEQRQNDTFLKKRKECAKCQVERTIILCKCGETCVRSVR